jgi:hypothetical protein
VIEYRVQCLASVNMVINLQVPYKVGASWLVEQLLAYQDGLCAMELDLRFLFLPMVHHLVMVGDFSSIQ